MELGAALTPFLGDKMGFGHELSLTLLSVSDNTSLCKPTAPKPLPAAPLVPSNPNFWAEERVKR